MKKQRRECVVELVRPTGKPELTCADGEVGAWQRVPWLDAPQEGETSSTASKKESVVVEYSVAQGRRVAALPRGARALTFHIPESDAARVPRAVYLAADGTIGTVPADLAGGQGSTPGSTSGSTPGSTPGSNQGSTQSSNQDGASGNVATAGAWPSRCGTPVAAFPYRDMVVLQGTKGVCWLLYDVQSGKYRLLAELPEPPQVTFTMEPAQMDGYTVIAGNLPEIVVETDLSQVSDTVDSAAVARWLGEGKGTAVDSAVKEAVYEAVAQGVERYEEDVRDAGFFLVPQRVVAAFGDALPSAAVTVDSGYDTPYARLRQWSVNGCTLRLTLEFTLRPMRLCATFATTALQRSWSPIFPKLHIYISGETGWRIGSTSSRQAPLMARALANIPASRGGGTGFRFNARNRSGVMALASAMCDFRMSEEVDIAESASGQLYLRRPNPASAQWWPEYADFDTPVPDGAAVTDEGVVLWRDRELYTPMAGNGVVYRYADRIADTAILGVAQASQRKGMAAAARHALDVFCADAVRRVEYDGAGGYRNSRIISRAVLSGYGEGSTGTFGTAGENHVAPVADGTAFLTGRGVEHISFTGKVTSPERDFPAGLTAETVVAMHYSHCADALLVYGGGGKIFVYRHEGDEWYVPVTTPALSATATISHHGRIYSTGADGSLAEILLQRESRTVTAGEAQLPPAEEGYARLRTRAMKFGAPFVRKRITSVSAAVQAEVRIEGSDDLGVWRLLAAAAADIRGLHLAAYRYHRLTLTVPASEADRLRSISIGISI